MNIQYLQLLSLHIHHDYYADGICRAIRLVPTQSAQQLLSAYHMRLVERVGKVELYYQSEGNTVPFLGSETQDFCLDFRLEVTDPLFYNFTDVDISNLQQQGFLSVWEINRDRLAAAEVFSGHVPKMPPINQGENNQAAGGEASDRKIILQDGVDGRDFGLLRLVFPLSGGVSADWMNRQSIPAIKLNFSARSTTWRYYIISQSDSSAQTPIRIDGGGTQMNGATFDLLPEKATLPNGQEAYVLQSSVPIPLRDRYDEHFKLSVDEQVSGSGTPINLDLPNASANQIKTFSSDGLPAGPYSDLYVYL
ncbi:MAG: hypothetical protein AAGF87_08625 [Bacteroidota bacterium]